MNAILRARERRILLALGAMAALGLAGARGAAAQSPPSTVAQPPTRVTLDQAIDLAIKHNHALAAARTTILQSQALEITANLRPNPVLSWDAQFLPIFQPSNFSGTYLDNTAQFDLGIGYTFERGKKRQHRLQAAKDVTAVTTSLVADNERSLTSNVALQFVGVLLAQSEVDLAEKDLASFQQTVNVTESQYKSGAISEDVLLKMKLQLLQFQMDLSAANLAKVQALASLRQLLGYESVPASFDVEGQLVYQPVKLGEDDLKAMALRQRPDLRAAQQGVTSAQSQFKLAQANGKRDLGASFNYSHLGGLNTGSVFFNIQLPLFDRNQGEIARTRSVIAQSQELSSEQSSLVLTDVTNSYEALRTSDQVVQLYRSGYLQQANDSLDISRYAYQRGAASLLDFLDAERTYRSTQLGYLQSLADYMLALEQLRQAVGNRSLP